MPGELNLKVVHAARSHLGHQVELAARRGHHLTERQHHVKLIAHATSGAGAPTAAGLEVDAVRGHLRDPLLHTRDHLLLAAGSPSGRGIALRDIRTRQ
jgi:hypothetical protein